MIPKLAYCALVLILSACAFAPLLMQDRRK